MIADGSFDAYLYKWNSSNDNFEIEKIGSVTTYESSDYASVKASVDDNTLDLTQGILNDKVLFRDPYICICCSYG